ncbi:MAG: DUF6516 family protein [bacterium]|nr:DUF6516 family protein [bacterium]
MSSRDEAYNRLLRLALSEFSDIVEGTKIVEGKLRLLLSEQSFIDIWFSEKKRGVYAYHWERKNINGSIYRHDNLPDKEARKLKTFPKHFHNGSQEAISESHLSDQPQEALRSILLFVRSVIQARR